MIKINDELFNINNNEYIDLDTGEIETREGIESYYNMNPYIQDCYESVDDLINQCYKQVSTNNNK